MQTAQEIITNAGLRPTKARLAVLKTIAEANSALSHPEILDRLAGQSEFDRVTIYRVLEWLNENALIHKISGENRAWKFQLSQPKFLVAEKSSAKAFKQNAHQHAHLHCANCGKISCLHELSPHFPKEILKQFQVSHIEINLKGLCAECAQALSSK